MKPKLLPAAAALLAAASAAAGCYNRNDLTAPDDLFFLAASPAAIPADGISTTRITARVSPSVDRSLAVGFTASAGTISTATFSPDSNGEVSTLLKSTTTPQSVLVTATVRRGTSVEASRTVTVTFEPAENATLVRLALSSVSLEADGASNIQVRAEVNPGITPREVKFETTAGSFSPMAPTMTMLPNVPTGADGIARVLLYAPRQIGTALVTVSAGGFSASETVTFVRALPDAISLKAAPLSIPPSETASTKVTATLTRALGSVTQGTRVDFSIVSDVTGDSFGRFQSIERSNAAGEATADFVAGTAAPLGLATITARQPDSGLTATIKIRIGP